MTEQMPKIRQRTFEWQEPIVDRAQIARALRLSTGLIMPMGEGA